MTTITALPTPPSRDDPANFASRGDAFMAALPDFVTETNLVAGEVNTNAGTATTQAGIATTQAGNASTSAGTATTKAGEALTSANNAAASETAAANYAAALNATSTTSLTIGTGSKTFTTQASKQFAAGQFVIAVDAASNANYMHGQVTSYSSTSLVIDVQSTGGSGTIANWKIYVAGNRGATGAAGAGGDFMADGSIPLTGSLVFEGTTADAYETTITVVNPTADRTVTIPDESFEIGFRKVPLSGSEKTASYTLVASDSGKRVTLGASGALEIPNSIMAADDVVSVFNNTASTATITCSITTAYIAGTNSDKATMTLAARGLATILFLSATACVVTGNVT
jgi:hypothetical protein